jgi:nucleoside phosphorylase
MGSIIPIVVKSVCDFGDNKKNDKWQKYAAHTSAQFIFHMIFDVLGDEGE